MAKEDPAKRVPGPDEVEAYTTAENILGSSSQRSGTEVEFRITPVLAHFAIVNTI